MGMGARLDLGPRPSTEVPINLLPHEVVGEQRARRYFSMAVAAAAALAVLLAGLTVLQHVRISKARHALEATKAEAASLQARTASLAQFDELDKKVQQTRRMLGTALVGDVNWTRFLDDLDRRIPGDSVLTSLSLSTTAETTAPDGEPSYGTVQYAGTVGSMDGLAHWLEAIAASKGVHFVYLGNGSKDPQTGKVTFSASAYLTQNALSGRCQTESAPCP